MNKNLTHVVLIVDRSGSMSTIKEEAQNGINQFIKDQKKVIGDCNLTLVQFDDQYEVVYDNRNIKEIKTDFELVPRGMTALLDAVGKTINDKVDKLTTLKEKDKPGLVVVCIVTDGQENSSQEFKKTQIKELIGKQKDNYKWQFTFLGANQDAFEEGMLIGIDHSSIANYAGSKSAVMYSNLSNNVTRMRNASTKGVSVNSFYTEEEKETME